MYLIRHHHAVERITERRFHAIRDAAHFDFDRRLRDFADAVPRWRARKRQYLRQRVGLQPPPAMDPDKDEDRLEETRHSGSSFTSRRSRSCNAPKLSTIAATVRAPD